jgi:hypothetical protein
MLKACEWVGPCGRFRAEVCTVTTRLFFLYLFLDSRKDCEWVGRLLRKISCRSMYCNYERLLSVSVPRLEKRLKVLQESGEVKTRSLYFAEVKRQI